ncbi:hypothetical protein EOM60_04680 [Candidatus Saccharibacteria bacterium]|nr:hypothetical protein [Candidatus Saccharibacteria bacterium]
MNLSNAYTRILLVASVVVGLIGVPWILNTEQVAAGDAQSLCTNLQAYEFDKDIGATNYDVESKIVGNKADLLQMGYLCEDGQLVPVEVIEVTNEMNPEVTDPTCDADGELVLLEVDNTTWEWLVDDEWMPVKMPATPGAYTVRLVADKGYALSRDLSDDVTVQPRLSGKACYEPPPPPPVPEPVPDTKYVCRTNGPNGGPSFLAFEPDKRGPYSYGPAFTASTVEGARQSIHDQGWCDPAWMLQKYREYVDYKMSSETADAKVLELIEQGKAGNQDQWDKMVDEIMNGFDNAHHEFTSIDPGWYHSLGVLTNTANGVPRVVNHDIYDKGRANVLRSTMTYADGTVRVLNLRTACNLQLRTPVAETPTGPAEAPQMAEISRTVEGVPMTPTAPAQPPAPPAPPAPPTTPPTTEPAPEPTTTTEPAPEPTTTTEPAPEPTTTTEPAPEPSPTKPSAPPAEQDSQPESNDPSPEATRPAPQPTPLLPDSGEPAPPDGGTSDLPAEDTSLNDGSAPAP